ncbi:MAG TPA: PHP domain-containing protein [Oligoflexia bacterium]|nr:PHP domain-containing protein [Oligoflexia bacterium]HMP48633.1 PHP domain-containing protein [Oligoflexia bacterium]
MTTEQAATIFDEITALLELSGANSFKIRAYDNATKILKRENMPLNEFLDLAKSGSIKGFGKDLTSKIEELSKTEKITELTELRGSIPSGLLELLRIKTLGGKKIRLLNETLGIKNIEDLVKACENESLIKVKGFGEKTSITLRKNIAFYLAHKGMIRLNNLENIFQAINEKLMGANIYPLGEAARFSEIIKKIEFLGLSKDRSVIISAINNLGGTLNKGESDSELSFSLGPNNISITIYLCSENSFSKNCFKKTADSKHLEYLAEYDNYNNAWENFSNESDFYKSLGLPVFPPEMREGLYEKEFLDSHPELNIPGLDLGGHLISKSQLKGALHVHSTYSDGKNSIRDLAIASLSLGFSYLGITDHSKSAAYAGGLTEDKIKKQHDEIDKLNEELAPFKILKGIESDILKNGDLDYSDNILSSFDFIIASIHQRYAQNKTEMTERIITAIRNPFTTILGHPTGRLLLERSAYDIDIDKILIAAIESGTWIECNSNPKRLDLSAENLWKAKSLNIPLVITPDAHNLDQLEFVKYGVYQARKAGILPNQVMNTLSPHQFITHLNIKDARR